MKNVLILLTGLLLTGCADRAKPTSPPTAAHAPGDTLSPPVAPAAAPTEPTAAPTVAGWQYTRSGTTHKATITSPTRLQFAFPYEGGSTATLTLRQRNGSTSVYIEVSKGQFNRSFQGGSARVRFDNRPAESFELLAAENGRANILFFGDEQRLIQRIRAARQLVVDIDFAGQGIRRIPFPTAGLVWPTEG